MELPLSKNPVIRRLRVGRVSFWDQVLDNTYEHFVYDNRNHFCVGGRQVINIFSFSKAYGMMGWRMVRNVMRLDLTPLVHLALLLALFCPWIRHRK